MVKPLKTWQHAEPKGFWPVLGGLALLSHVGFLGMALPYVFDLLAPVGNGSGGGPIELVWADEGGEDGVRSQLDAVVPAEEENSVTETQADESEETPQSTSAERAVQQSASRPSRIQTNNSSASTADSDGGATGQGDGLVSDDNSGVSGGGGVAGEDDDSGEGSENGGEGEDGEGDDDDGGGEAGDVGGGEGESSGGEGAGANDGGPPVAGGGETLTPPGEGGDEAEAVGVVLRIVDYGVPPLARDVSKTPPRPQEVSMGARMIPFGQVSCPRVRFPAEVVSLQIQVAGDGAVLRVTPRTASGAEGTSENERAIACLIEAGGFEFEPGLDDEDRPRPVSDDLLITVSAVEARSEDI